jgi:hypothetical protein
VSKKSKEEKLYTRQARLHLVRGSNPLHSQDHGHVAYPRPRPRRRRWPIERDVEYGFRKRGPGHLVGHDHCWLDGLDQALVGQIQTSETG